MNKPKFKPGDKVVVFNKLSEVVNIDQAVYTYGVRVPGHKSPITYTEHYLNKPKSLPKYNTGDIVKLNRGKVLREITAVTYSSTWGAGDPFPIYCLRGMGNYYSEDKFTLVCPKI